MTFLRVAVPVLTAATLHGCCDDALLDTSTSPDGRLAVDTFERNCHATAPHMTVVSVRRASMPVFLGKVIVEDTKGPQIYFQWAEGGTLELIGAVPLELRAGRYAGWRIRTRVVSLDELLRLHRSGQLE